MAQQAPARRGWRRLNLGEADRNRRQEETTQSHHPAGTQPAMATPGRDQMGGRPTYGRRQEAPEASQNGNSKPRRWVDLFTKNRACSEDTALQVFAKHHERLNLVAEDQEPIEKAMGYCLVGRFLGRSPGWKAIMELTKRWDTPHQLLTHESSWLIFKFEFKEASDGVLKGGGRI